MNKTMSGVEKGNWKMKTGAGCFYLGLRDRVAVLFLAERGFRSF
jgi:hypothetical protein